MDPRQRLTNDEADRALRDLFRSAGPLSAPEGLDERVLESLAAQARPAIVPEKPLIPALGWWLGGALFALVMAYLWLGSGPVSSDPAWLSNLIDLVPRFHMPGILTSGWLLMTTVGLAALLWIEMLVGRKRSMA